MAAKRDLVEAQTFSRRRLLTAFLSGAPGGQELEPTKPLRGVVAGVTLSVIVVLGSIGWGMLQRDPTGWENERLVVVEDVGTRYVSSNGDLYPVLNVTSARLAIPSTSFAVVQLGADVIADAPRRATIGIPGAPDSPPAPESLVASGWTSCVATDGVATSVGVDVATTPEDAVAVVVEDRTFVVADGVRHLVPADQVAAVLRATGLDVAPPVEVPAQWLNLFPEGSDLVPLTVPGAGEPAPGGTGLRGLDVGTVVNVTAVGQEDRAYVVLEDGTLAELSPFATGLYALGSGARAEEVDMSSAQVARAGSGDPVAPADWPADAVTPLPGDRAACAVLTTGARAGVALVSAEPTDAAGVSIVPGGGALFLAQSAPDAAGAYGLVDETGLRFGLPGADEETLARLGYTPDDVVVVPPAWADLFAAGPDLTTTAATIPSGP